jgi:hypothetical protein
MARSVQSTHVAVKYKNLLDGHLPLSRIFLAKLLFSANRTDHSIDLIQTALINNAVMFNFILTANIRK